jgi:hypothetical protein
MAAEIQARQPQMGLTFENVWAMFQETDKKFQETDRKIQAMSQETDRKIQAMSQETDRKIQETGKQIWETGKQLQETKELIKELGRQIGGVHHSFGKMAEYMVAPSIAKRFNERGFHFDEMAQDGVTIWGKDGQILTEIDLLLENRESIVVVEVKAEPKVEDIQHHLKRLAIVRSTRDNKGDSRVIQGAIAGAIFEKSVKKAVLEAGLYVIAQSGETMRLEIPADFKPREW